MKQSSNIESFMLSGDDTRAPEHAVRTNNKTPSADNQRSDNGLGRDYQRAAQVGLLDADSERAISNNMAQSREAMTRAMGRL